MRAQLWLGIVLFIGGPVLLAVLYLIGLITNLMSTIDAVIALVVAGMMITGAGFIYKGSISRPDGTPKDPLTATKKWVQDQLPRLIVDDFIIRKNQPNPDGSRSICGTATTKSVVAPDIGLGAAYDLHVVLTAENTVDSSQSWVKKRPFPV